MSDTATPAETVNILRARASRLRTDADASRTSRDIAIAVADEQARIAREATAQAAAQNHAAARHSAERQRLLALAREAEAEADRLAATITDRYVVVAVSMLGGARSESVIGTTHIDATAAGYAAIGMAMADANGRHGNHLVRHGMETSKHDVETWCADAPDDAPIYAVRKALR